MKHTRSLLLFSSLLSVNSLFPAEKSQPNIVFLLIDDLGYGEFSCYGNTFNETPNIDRMAQEGMRFTQAYAGSAVSSPTRACFHTGQYTPRHGICDFLPENDKNYLDPAKHVTVNEALKQAGYATGLIGKWHLDTDFKNNHGGPKAHGYDWVFGTETKYIAGGDYFYPYDKISSITDGIPNEFLTDRLFAEANAYMGRQKDKPFFLSLQLYSTHMTLEAPEATVRKYKKKYEDKYGAGTSAAFDTSSPRHAGAPDNPYLAAMLEHIDAGVGSIVQTLKDLGIDDNTLFVVTTDNGGDAPVANNGGLREAKTWLYEGGIRVPLVMRYPGVCPAGQVDETPVNTIDFYPTFLELAGGETSQLLDGVSLLPLFGGKELGRDELYWYYPAGNSGWNPRKACVIRKGDYKLIYRFALSHDKYELYNLKNDPGETVNLYNNETVKADELKAKLKNWMKEVGLPNLGDNTGEFYLSGFETEFTLPYGTKGNIVGPPASGSDAEDTGHTVFCRVANPDRSGLNESAYVARFTRKKEGYWWAYGWFDFEPVYVAASEAEPMYLHVKVKKAIASKICLQLVGPNNCSTPEIVVSNRKTGQWEDVVFEIVNPGFYSSVQLKPDFENSVNPPYPSRLQEDLEIYFDDLLINADPAPLGGDVVEFEDVLVQNFENGFIGKWGTNGNPANGVIEDHEAFKIVPNPLKNQVNNTDMSVCFNRKKEGLWWAYSWFEFPTVKVDIVPIYLHVMVNKPLKSTVCAQMKDKDKAPVYNTGEIKNEDQTMEGLWEDMVFKIQTPGTYSYFEFKPDFINRPAGSKLEEDLHIYFDEIVLSKSAVPRQNIVGNELRTMAKFRLWPTSVSDELFIESADSRISSVQVFDNTGRLVYVQNPGSESVLLNLAVLLPGVYCVRVEDRLNVEVCRILKK